MDRRTDGWTDGQNDRTSTVTLAARARRGLSISLSISELQEHASSRCSLLWYTKGIVYQQNYYKIVAESLYSTCLQSFVHVYIQVIELQELACHIVMYGPKLFIAGFPKKEMFTQILLYLFSCSSPNSYHLTKFQMLVYSG